MSAGCLYIVATPIGNLSDITYRAVETLNKVDLIAAEDTRHSKILLSHYSINTPLLSLHEHNETARTDALLSRLQQGDNIALISDAGTPLISDPGFHLVRALKAADIRVVPIPGPSALIAALSAAGLPTQHFVFEGFLPAKGAARDKAVQALQHETRTIVLYESSHRIQSLITLLITHFGEARIACIARELTKTFETIMTAPLSVLQRQVEEDPNQRKGEFVVIVQGAEKAVSVDEQAEQHLLSVLMEELTLKQAVALAVKISGLPKKKLYADALKLKGESS